MNVYSLPSFKRGFSGSAVVQNPPINAGDARYASSIPRSGRSPGMGNGNPLQYSCLENSMDRRAVHRAAESQAHGARQRYIIPCYHLLPVWRVTQRISFELWIFTYLPFMILCDWRVLLTTNIISYLTFIWHFLNCSYCRAGG